MIDIEHIFKIGDKVLIIKRDDVLIKRMPSPGHAGLSQ